MKVLIVGANSNYAIERFYLKYMSDEAGWEVELFEAQNMFLEYWQKNIINKIIFRLGYQKIYHDINQYLKAKITGFKPDIVFAFKGMEIFPETIQWIKKQGIKVLNYNPDNPFVFSGKGSGNRNVKDSIPLYDLHLTYNLSVKEEMESKYKIPTAILPFGFDVNDNLMQRCIAEDEINKTCFLGNPDKYRALFLQKLAEAGIELDVYGNNWNDFINHKNIKVYSPVFGDDFWVTLRKYRVQLNLMRPHNPDSHNMRSFEIPGIGGIQLATDTPDHKAYFTEGKEIFLYSTVEECATQIKFLTSLPFEDALQVREEARKRSLKSGYSYKDRAKQTVKYIKALNG